MGPSYCHLQCMSQLLSYSTPTLQLRKLMPQAQALSQRPSTSDIAKTISPHSGEPPGRISSRRPYPRTNPQLPGPPRKENRASSCLHRFNPCYPGPQFQSPSRPHFPSPGHSRPSHLPHPFPLGGENRTQSPRGHSFPALTLVEYRPMTLV